MLNELWKNLRIKSRRLRWKLTWSYTVVTASAMLVVVMLLGLMAFSTVMLPVNVLAARDWVNIVEDDLAPVFSSVLAQTPVDIGLVDSLLDNMDSSVATRTLFRLGDLEFGVRTTAEIDFLVVGSDGALLGVSKRRQIPGAEIGQPAADAQIPGLGEALRAALSGEVDPERLVVTIEPDEKFILAAPVYDWIDGEDRLLGVLVVNYESLPTSDESPARSLWLVGRSFIFWVLGMGILGAVLGALTANGLVRRFHGLSKVADAWSQGDFSGFIDDDSGDELSQLAQRLNSMAEQLQDLLDERQELAVTEERNRLARDLHDSAKQQALAASLQLGAGIALLDEDLSAARLHLVEAESLLDAVRTELTDLIHELRPGTMAGRDLSETLGVYIAEWAHRTNISATFEATPDCTLPLDVKQTLYRITQEALANVDRHSGANSIWVEMKAEDQEVQLEIKDDGCGFDPQAELDGYGLLSMQERAKKIGGQFHVQSRLGEGTLIRVCFPCHDV